MTLAIYDITGRRVTTLVDRAMESGLERVVWNGTDARGNPTSSGVYLYRIEAGEAVAIGKMLLLKPPRQRGRDLAGVGSTMVKVEPSPDVLPASMRPPRLLTMISRRWRPNLRAINGLRSTLR